MALTQTDKMDSDKPKNQLNLKDLNNVMRQEARGIATRWYTLGVELLDGDTAVLDMIETNHQSDDDRCSRMFKKWLEMKTDANWDQLVTALKNIGLNAAADNVHHSKISKEGMSIARKETDAEISNIVCTAASAEFGILLEQILEELKKCEINSLKSLKIMSTTLTVKDKSGVRMFSDSEIEDIRACNDIDTLLAFRLRHCYRWDDHSMLTVLMKRINSEKCLNLLQLFDSKVYGQFKLQQICEQVSQKGGTFPEGYDKMIAIVDKIFSDITKEEYDELKQFISQHCGVEPYVISPFSKASPFSSVVFEWFIPVSAVSYMIEEAKNNVTKFTKEKFLYLRISSTVIFDHRANEGRTALHLATMEGQVQAMETLIRLGADALDMKGRTTLHHAVRQGKVQVIETLIRLGADVNALDWPEGRTALHLATMEGQVQAIETLIRLGADVNALDMPEGRTALHLATMEGQVQAIETLIRLGADVNALDMKGRTTLHHAVRQGKVQVTETLIRLGADVNALDWGGRTALHHAAIWNQIQAIETLIRLGADVNVLDKEGSTALHHAARSGQVQAIETLIRFGADVNALDEFGRTALHYAAMCGHVQAIEVLIRFGADVNALDEYTQSRIKKMLGHKPLPLPTKQSSMIRDHKSTTGESEVLEMKQKEQESKTL